jgi:hypothetical protein
LKGNIYVSFLQKETIDLFFLPIGSNASHERVFMHQWCFLSFAAYTGITHPVSRNLRLQLSVPTCALVALEARLFIFKHSAFLFVFITENEKLAFFNNP